MNLTRIVGSPHSDLFDLKAVHVDYGSSLAADDYRGKGGAAPLPGLTTIPSNEGTGVKTVDVTTALQYAWENSDKAQFSLYFRTATDNDNSAEYVQIAYEDRPGTTLIPALKVRVQNY